MSEPRSDESTDDSEVVAQFREYQATRDVALRNDLIEAHVRLAEFCARRFVYRGEPFDDLRQVALVGLLKAVERFDPDRGVRFTSFATPTVVGELKRHFRDRGWAVRVPRRLQELLQQYPPSLGRVLALDPTLLGNDEYLQPYPQLEALLAQHPEIAHNPSYFFDPQYRELSRREYDYNAPRIQVIRAVDEAFAGVAFLIGFMTVVLTIAWVVRSVMEHRKWLRASKTHVDTHTRLMERLTSNEELIAYMQSPAGRRFLEAAPIPLDSGPKMLNAPFGRILWSVQAGVIVAALGVGLIYASMRLGASEMYGPGEIPLLVVGIAALAIGVGFFVSAIAAYGLSHRLGLFAGGGPSPSEPGSSHGA